MFEELKQKARNPKSEEFKEIQRKILRIIQKNEDNLCSKTESTKYLNFSAGLSDKFRDKIRKNYPEIDYGSELE